MDQITAPNSRGTATRPLKRNRRFITQLLRPPAAAGRPRMCVSQGSLEDSPCPGFYADEVSCRARTTSVRGAACTIRPKRLRAGLGPPLAPLHARPLSRQRTGTIISDPTEIANDAHVLDE